MPTPFCTKLAKTAEKQHTMFHDIQETDQPLRRQIQRYWEEIGLSFPGVATPWSAVFVSFCVMKAGAIAAEFEFAQGHARFVHKAIDNAKKGIGVFRGVDVTTAEPEVGDIIQNNRGGNKFDFVFATNHDAYLSHSAIVVETGTDSRGRFARTIGGNEHDSIRPARVPLTKAGTIQQRTPNPYISVIKTLK